MKLFLVEFATVLDFRWWLIYD